MVQNRHLPLTIWHALILECLIGCYCCRNDDHERSHVKPALEKTLKDLGLDYIDLFLVNNHVSGRCNSLCMYCSAPHNFVIVKPLQTHAVSSMDTSCQFEPCYNL